MFDAAPLEPEQKPTTPPTRNVVAKEQTGRGYPQQHDTTYDTSSGAPGKKWG